MKWFSRSDKPAQLDVLFTSSISRQKHIINVVNETSCPKCGAPLRAVCYENDHILAHFEVAVLCDTCTSKFVFNEKGIRGEYAEKAKAKIGGT